MGHYKRKPLVIEAIPVIEILTSRKADYEMLPGWVHKAIGDGVIELDITSAEVITSHGTVRAGIRDWLLRNPRGEVYPCKGDLFHELYERVEH